MTDRSTSDKKRYGLTWLERERRISEIFNFHTANSDNILWDCYWDSEPFHLYDLSEISDVIVELWQRHANRVSLSFSDEPGYILSLCDPKKTIASMVENGVLPVSCGYKDIDSFFAERAVLARWYGLKYLADEDAVPVGASFWWEKYIDHPRTLNPVHDCGLLIAGTLLKKNFNKVDFLRFALNRCHIYVAVHDVWMCPGNAWKWELTTEGMEAAEEMGLLNPEPYATEEAVPVSTRKIIKTDNKPVDTSGYFSIADLIARNNIPDCKKEAFRKAIERWHNKNPDSSAVQEITERNQNQAQWIYKADVLFHIIKKYQQQS